MGLVSELRRRNVFRVAIAYVIIAWLILQVGDTLAPALHLGEWVNTALAFFLILGFPMALFFAWAFEMTPEGLKKEKDVVRSESVTHITGRKLDFIIIGVLAVALVLFAVERFVLLPDRAPATDALQEVIATEVQQSIAVLPFVNMSPDPDQEYFADGLSEEILNLLAKIPELKVIGRTSSFAFKGKNEDLRIIGQALDVKTLLEGSVQKSGDRVRITAQLIAVSDGSHIWSETYNRTMTDIFAVQDDVAAAIIDELQIHVGVNPTRGRPTENTEAYALFLNARALLSRMQWNRAEELLLKAIELDLNFAEAHEMLASIYWRRTDQKRTVESAAKAIAIDPDLVYAQALYQSASIGTHLADIEAFERAVREQPNNPELLGQLSWVLLQAGYLQEAVRLQEQVVDLNPLSFESNLDLGNALHAVGRMSEAVAALEVADQLNPGRVNWYLGEVNLVEKRDEVAIAHFEASLEQRGLPSNWVRELVTGARDPVTGQAYLDRRIPQILASLPEERVPFWQRIMLAWYLYFGFPDQYFEPILDRDLTDSWEMGLYPEALLFHGVVLRRSGFTAHPKYLEVAEAMGIIKIWEKRGPPDFCEKVGGEWICE